MSLFGSLVNLAINVVETPIAVIKDVATLGAELTDEKGTYTGRKMEEMGKRTDKIKKQLDN